MTVGERSEERGTPIPQDFISKAKAEYLADFNRLDEQQVQQLTSQMISRFVLTAKQRGFYYNIDDYHCQILSLF